MSRPTDHVFRTLCLATASICLVAVTADADPGAKLVRHPDAIPNRYIVVLDQTPATALSSAARARYSATIDRLATSQRATVKHRYSTALQGFAAELSPAAAAELADDPSVAYVEDDVMVHGDTIQAEPTWGLDRIDQVAMPLDHKYVELGDGAGVTVYVVDSGIRTTHSEFTGRIRAGVWALDAGLTSFEDCHGHGTHVAGTIGATTWGVAKAVELVPVRVLDCTNSGPVSGVIAGIDWVAANYRSPAVANLSFGVNGINDAEDAAVRNLIAVGVTVVAAAGNNDANACLYSPARVPEAITVGATTESDARASYSNWGSCVDLSAPGDNITSAGIGNDHATWVYNGTSQATPHVTGAVALYLGAHPTARPAEVAAAVIGGATLDQITDARSSPNRLLHVRFVDTELPTASIQSPRDGATVANSFTVVAAAVDANLAAVALAIDGTVIATRTTPPFTFEVEELAAGSHVLAVTSIDLVGQSATASVSVEVDDNAVGPDAPEAIGGCAVGAGADSLIVVVALGLILARRRRGQA